MATHNADYSVDGLPLSPSSGSPPQYTSELLANLQSSKRVVLNVGGIRHEVMWKTLDRLPNTRLGKLRYCTTHEALMELCDDYNAAESEFFFDRQSRSFSAILDFYQTGTLHLAEDVCVLSFKKELEYWNIDELCLDSCCQDRYHHRKELVLERMRHDAKSQLEEFGTGNCVKLWNLLEKPHTSRAALLFAIVSVLVIILCAVALMAITLPSLVSYRLQDPSSISSDEVEEDGYWPHDNRPLSIIVHSCVAWFTLEYILRLVASPGKLSFIRDVFNGVDLLATTFYYISLMLPQSNPSAQRFKDFARFLQILRLVRLVKLARYSTGVRSLGYALRRSWRELGLLVMFLVIEVIVFASMVYFVERHEVSSHFMSIPDALWWAVVTMTTVGYGDMIPVGAWGKLVGTGCSICGVLFIVLPIPILVYNFAGCYEEEIRRDKATRLNLAKRGGHNAGLNAALSTQEGNLGSGGGRGGGKDPTAVEMASSPPYQAKSI